MTFDPERMLESKLALRRRLANRPLAEKLAMLDALRERALDIRKAAVVVVEEKRYRVRDLPIGETGATHDRS